MLSLFSFRRPRVGVSFSPDAISLVELSSRWPGRRSVRRAVTEPLPSGVLVPNPDRLNVTDAAKFIDVLRKALKVTRRRTVAVSLPISSVHMGIFAFDQLSSRAEDRLAVLRWRFQHDEHIDVGEATIVHRMFPAQQANGPTYVLAVAVKRHIFQQYEEMLEAAGLMAVSIGWSTLQLFDMGRSLRERASEVFLVHEDPQTMTVVAVRDGTPVFVRKKAGPTRDTPHELSRTLRYYDDLYPHHPADQTVGASRLYQFREHPAPGEEALQERAGGEMLAPIGGSSWRIQLMPPTRMCAVRSIDMVNGMGQWSALASVYTA